MKKKTALIAAAVLIIALSAGIWRFWPHSLSSVISVEKSAVSGIACSVCAFGVENGKPYSNGYTLSEQSPQEDGFGEILEILDSSNYRRDFRNLLPWSIDSVGSDDTGLSAVVVLVWGSRANESCVMSMQGGNMIAVSSGAESGLKVYHPTNREMLNALAEYLQAHGNNS